MVTWFTNKIQQLPVFSLTMLKYDILCIVSTSVLHWNARLIFKVIYSKIEHYVKKLSTYFIFE